MAGAAADVGHVDAPLKGMDEAGHQRQRRMEEGGVVDGAAVFGHEGRELREVGVGHAAAVTEAVDNLVFHLSEQADVLGLQGAVLGPAARVSQAARSGGRRNVIAAGSWSTKPPVVMADSHSRTYRSFSPAASAICSLVAAGSDAMVSNRPTRCPRLVIRANAPAFKTSTVQWMLQEAGLGGSILGETAEDLNTSAMTYVIENVFGSRFRQQPRTGDLMMWGGHVGLVADVRPEEGVFSSPTWGAVARVSTPST